MSNLAKFMMTIVAIAFLAFLNSGTLSERLSQPNALRAIPRDSKLPV